MQSRSKGIAPLFQFLLLFLLMFPQPAGAVPLPERPPNYVVDLARIIDDGREYKLDRYLRELEEKTTTQFVILTIPSLEGESIEDFSITVAHDRWKLGQKGEDNGLLLVVAVQDRKYRIEVGYGLEGILPDSLVGSIGRENLVPAFRRGDYSGGITRAALVLANVIASDRGVTITGMPKPTRPQPVRGRRKPTLCGSISSILFFIVMAILFIRNPRLFFMLFLMSSIGGRRGPWGGGGGGFGGGFGGGGGGFGGGGASGSW